MESNENISQGLGEEGNGYRNLAEMIQQGEKIFSPLDTQNLAEDMQQLCLSLRLTINGNGWICDRHGHHVITLRYGSSNGSLRAFKKSRILRKKPEYHPKMRDIKSSYSLLSPLKIQ